MGGVAALPQSQEVDSFARERNGSGPRRRTHNRKGGRVSTKPKQAAVKVELRRILQLKERQKHHSEARDDWPVGSHVHQNGSIA